MWREESVQLISDLHKLFSNEFQELRLAIQSVQLLRRHESHRPKRRLLPFVGNFMKSLFGTATHSDLRDLKHYLQETRHIQSQVIHVVKESVSILNTTSKRRRNEPQTHPTTSKRFRILSKSVESSYRCRHSPSFGPI